MSTNAHVELFFGDKKYLFKLNGIQVEELQKLCGASFYKIVNRVITGDAYIADIQQTIRLGAIGGGLAPVLASQLWDTYGYPNQPFQAPNDPASPYATAKAILLAALFGFNELGEEDEEAVKSKKNLETTESTSTISEQPSSSFMSTQMPSLQ